MSAFGWSSEWARRLRLRTLAVAEVGSTQQLAKDEVNRCLLRQERPPQLILADHQSAGRGRSGTIWLDEEGKALLSSWIFLLPKLPSPLISPLVGLRLIQSVSVVWPQVHWALKAPNDLHVLNSKSRRPEKIAGVIIETQDHGSTENPILMIVGLGFNVNGAPTGVAPYPAKCLFAAVQEVTGISPTESQWCEFLKLWHDGLEKLASTSTLNSLWRQEKPRLIETLKTHPVHQNLMDITESGDLLVKNSQGQIVTQTWDQII